MGAILALGALGVLAVLAVPVALVVPAVLLAEYLVVAVAAAVALAVAAVAAVAVVPAVAGLPCSSSSCRVPLLRIAPFYALFHLRFARSSASQSYVRAAFWGSNIHAPACLHALQPNTSTSALPGPLPCPPKPSLTSMPPYPSSLSMHGFLVSPLYWLLPRNVLCSPPRSAAPP